MLLRNAGQLVCIDPSLGMAEFRYNSAILPPFRPNPGLAKAAAIDPGRDKWQACGRSLPSAPQSATIPPRDHRPGVWSWFGAQRAASHRRIVSP